jgi:serine/threonine-protein kinase
MAMTVPQHMDRQTFLANLRQSGLLTAQQLAQAVSRLPDSPRARIVARALVEQKLLTKFQAELLLAGRTSGFLLGQYRILDQLGQGGMGRVFKAEHQTMNRVVALKVLSSQLVKTQKAQQLFQREVRAAARLIHPNIVTAYDANQIDNRYFLVMEFVDGPNLDELVRSKGPLAIAQACDFMYQAAVALQYAHEQGMVHRDIKPANLLIQKATGNAPARPYLLKILDFGLARLHSPGLAEVKGHDSILINENTVVGTPDYLSPEQARDLHQADIRSDLYSLGCTFYFSLTGKVAFPGGTTMEKLIRHGTEEPAPLEQLRKDIPAPVAAIVRRLMAKQPADRYQTPADLITTLAPFAVPVSAPMAAPVAVAVAAPAPTPPPFAIPITAPDSGLLDVRSTPADFEEDAPLTLTLPLDLAAPLTATGMPSIHLARAVALDQQQRLKVAVYVAIGIVTVALGLVSWLMLR